MRNAIIIIFDFIISPLLVIYALNCLKFEIPYELDTWLGAMLLLFLFNATSTTLENDNEQD